MMASEILYDEFINSYGNRKSYIEGINNSSEFMAAFGVDLWWLTWKDVSKWSDDVGVVRMLVEFLLYDEENSEYMVSMEVLDRLDEYGDMTESIEEIVLKGINPC
ncbi:MAG: hypothetical protein ACRC1P_09935 [Cellulosilyticaceae bacterium]